MTVIVLDGYNLIGAEAGRLSGLSLEREREGLIRRLEQLSAVTGERFLHHRLSQRKLQEKSSRRKTEKRNPQRKKGNNQAKVGDPQTGQTI
ncbi:MAG: hypothetical protein ACM3YF_06525, partial [Candidatus Zixiibacteriota bacterium]